MMEFVLPAQTPASIPPCCVEAMFAQPSVPAAPMAAIGRRRLRGVRPLGRQRIGVRRYPPYDLVQHDPDIWLAHPQVLGTVNRDHLGLWDPLEPLVRLGWAQ